MNKKFNPLYYLLLLKELFSILLIYFKSISKISDILLIDTLGRKIGLHELKSLKFSSGIKNILNPISLVRYFEYRYCYKQISLIKPKKILDISSPRLFSLFLALKRPNINIVMANPDVNDINITRHIIKFLKIKNIHLVNEPLHKLIETKFIESFDCIYTISVLEHIAGEYDDTIAIKMLKKLLKPTGSLILTVPLAENKEHKDEFLPFTPYSGSHNVKRSDGTFFFQRVYTEKSIKNRLINNFDSKNYAMEWWGEKEKGLYTKYYNSGYYNKGRDLEKFLANFQIFNNFDKLPGMGICGCLIQKK